MCGIPTVNDGSFLHSCGQIVEYCFWSTLLYEVDGKLNITTEISHKKGGRFCDNEHTN